MYKNHAMTAGIFLLALALSACACEEGDTAVETEETTEETTVTTTEETTEETTVTTTEDTGSPVVTEPEDTGTEDTGVI